jgi:hypothetical protein
MHHDSHMKSPRTEPMAPRSEVSVCLSYHRATHVYIWAHTFTQQNVIWCATGYWTIFLACYLVEKVKKRTSDTRSQLESVLTQVYLCSHHHIYSKTLIDSDESPCGGRVKYLHRSPTSRRKRRKREPSAWGYNWVTLFLGAINTGTQPSRLAESRFWGSKIWSWIPWDSDLRMTWPGKGQHQL